MDMHTVQDQDKAVIIIDKNKLIGVENETFQTQVQGALDKGSKKILIDLANVEYISSWGIGLLVHAYTSCHNKEVEFGLKGVNSQVMNVLSQLKLNTLFNVQ